jgi:HK97 gp10 family phage protein
MSVKVKLNKNFRGLKASYRAKCERVVAESAREVAAVASQLAPRDSGHLADESIAVVVTASTSVVRVVAQTADADHEEYSHLVEFGTSETDAQPFMGPAFDIVRPRMENRLRRLNP